MMEELKDLMNQLESLLMAANDLKIFDSDMPLAEKMEKSFVGKLFQESMNDYANGNDSGFIDDIVPAFIEDVGPEIGIEGICKLTIEKDRISFKFHTEDEEHEFCAEKSNNEDPEKEFFFWVMNRQED